LQPGSHGRNQHFAFGKNWQRYLSHINEDRVKSAERSIVEFLGLEDLRGKSFLDIGCGSGLFSYAAFRLGAARVVSFDPDPLSVECCRSFRQKAGAPKHWEIHQASILDANFTSRMDSFDIVYAWGTLQHTGNMWEALARAAAHVKSGGYLYVAIYNQVDGLLGSKFWLKVKRFYNALPRPFSYSTEVLAIPVFLVARSVRATSLVADVKRYELKRGMYWRTDITDWLGGLPYECATVEKVFRFIRQNCARFDLHNLKTTNSLGNNWYLFKRREV
jgi:SAM-dependent methyltransferase